jgi:hypothetical protein
VWPTKEILYKIPDKSKDDPKLGALDSISWNLRNKDIFGDEAVMEHCSMQDNENCKRNWQAVAERFRALGVEDVRYRMADSQPGPFNTIEKKDEFFAAQLPQVWYGQMPNGTIVGITCEGTFT